MMAQCDVEFGCSSINNDERKRTTRRGGRAAAAAALSHSRQDAVSVSSHWNAGAMDNIWPVDDEKWLRSTTQ